MRLFPDIDDDKPIEEKCPDYNSLLTKYKEDCDYCWKEILKRDKEIEFIKKENKEQTEKYYRMAKYQEDLNTHFYISILNALKLFDKGKDDKAKTILKDAIRTPIKADYKYSDIATKEYLEYIQAKLLTL